MLHIEQVIVFLWAVTEQITKESQYWMYRQYNYYVQMSMCSSLYLICALFLVL